MLPEPEKPNFNNDLVNLTLEPAEQVSHEFKSMLAEASPIDSAARGAQSVMAMFAEDVGLLRQKSSPKLSRTRWQARPPTIGVRRLEAMNKSASLPAAGTRAAVFNGGLSRTIAPFRLTEQELDGLREASRADWIAGQAGDLRNTVRNEYGPNERRAHGAHFTSETDIQKVVRPTIVHPWQERIDAPRRRAERRWR